jgi:protoporphyrinogen oxidase
MRVVVLGAGLTGLSTAWHLAQRGVEAAVLEREADPGGACRTLAQDGFEFDLTGHLLHLGRPESEDLLARLGVRAAMRRRRRLAGVALAGTVTPYPIQIHTHRLPAAVRRDCLLGFVEAHLRQQGQDHPDGSFAEWVLSRFGEGFARHFFFPYNAKLYRTPVGELTTEWVGRYVPRPSLAEVVDGALGLFHGAVGYNASFYYPRRGGIRLLADALAARVPGLRLGTAVAAMDLNQKTLVLDSGEVVEWDRLVSTVALTELVRLAANAPSAVGELAGTLRAVAVVNFNLGVRGRSPRREHWLYVPEERYPFYRVGIPSNHGSVGPAGCHTLSVEVSVEAGTPIAPDLLHRCLGGLEELGLLDDRRAVETVATARIDPAYVVFNAARPAAVAALGSYFREAGVVLAGRWAQWKYSTMEDALWDGANVARRLAP